MSDPITTLKYSASPEDFKDSQGRWRSASLFLETNNDETKYTSVFTLADDDLDGRLSMRRIYMDANDPTEFLAAKHIFGSLDCWTQLCKSGFFKPHVARWREELQRRLRSRSIKIIEDCATSGKVSAAQLAAAKWLATQEWDQNKIVAKKGPGRPVKVDDPSEKLREALNEEEETKEDLARIS